MTVVNPKSISGINSITTGSGSDDILTIHTNNGTERLRVDNTGTTKIVTGIVTTLTATTGIVTTLTANTVTSLGAVSGTTGTFSGAVSGTTGTFTGDVDIADTIVHTGDTNTKIRFPAADTITAETGGSERFRIQSDGRIAINDTGNANYTTFSPCLAIGDSGDSAPGLVIRGSTSSNCDISFCDNSGTESDDGVSEGLIRYDHSNDAMIFHTADGEKLRITSSGRLGLNTDSPDTTFTIKSGGDAQMSLKNSSGTTKAYLGTDGAFGSASTDDLRIRSDSSNIIFGFSGTEKVRMLSGGGISFNGDTATANALDDYEEGSWTPVLFGTTGSTNTTGRATATGHYTKIGNRVLIDFFVEANTGSAGGDIKVANLPFAPSSSPSHQWCGSFNWYAPGGAQSGSNYSAWVNSKLYLTNGDTNIKLLYHEAASNDATQRSANWSAVGTHATYGYFRVAHNFQYFTDA